MLLARVIGTVVSTRKSEKLSGTKLLIVEPVDFQKQKPEGKPIVAIDSVGAGPGEIVLVVQGSSARLTETTKDTPVDATVMAIVDYVDIEGKRTFAKS
jgi:microcompartment protein CcmK/EutM